MERCKSLPQALPGCSRAPTTGPDDGDDTVLPVPDSDNIHYEHFDYIGEHAIEHFTPSSDWEFLDFKRLLREEWSRQQ